MSTATATQNHFPHSITLAVAASVVAVGGLAVWGVAEGQNDAAPAHSTVNTSTSRHQMCPDDRCLPPTQRPGSGSRQYTHEPALKGGHTTIGLP